MGRPEVRQAVANWFAPRTVTDAVTTTTTTVTSATAAFTADDVGRTVAGTDIPTGTTIASVTNATTVVLSQAATGSHTGNKLSIYIALHLNTVTRGMKVVTDGADFFASPGEQMGAAAYMHLEQDREHRKAVGGATSGKKRVVHHVGLVVLFKSLQQEPGAGEVDPGEVAVDAHDILIEAIKTRLRSDRTLGGTVFSAGEGAELGADDIEIHSDLPRLVGTEIHIWTVVRFVVCEWITS